MSSLLKLAGVQIKTLRNANFNIFPHNFASPKLYNNLHRVGILSLKYLPERGLNVIMVNILPCLTFFLLFFFFSFRLREDIITDGSIRAEVLSNAGQKQWRLEYGTLEYRTHGNTKSYEVRISNGSVLEWSVIAIVIAMVSPNNWKSKQNGGHFALISNDFGQNGHHFVLKGKPNAIGKPNRELPLEFRTHLVFQPPLYSKNKQFFGDHIFTAASQNVKMCGPELNALWPTLLFFEISTSWSFRMNNKSIQYVFFGNRLGSK